MRDEAIDFRQTLRITPKITVKDILEKHSKKLVNYDLEEVSKFEWDQLVYDPTKENFSAFLKTLNKMAAQAFRNRAAKFVEAFVFGKLPVQVHHELSIAGKTEVKAGEMKTFIRRRI